MISPVHDSTSCSDIWVLLKDNIRVSLSDYLVQKEEPAKVLDNQVLMYYHIRAAGWT